VGGESSNVGATAGYEQLGNEVSVIFKSGA
jgi:hypothetical protein